MSNAVIRPAVTVSRTATKVRSDEVWEEVRRHYDEKQLAAIALWIATTNLFNRLSAITRTPAPQDWA